MRGDFKFENKNADYLEGGKLIREDEGVAIPRYAWGATSQRSLRLETCRRFRWKVREHYVLN